MKKKTAKQEFLDKENKTTDELITMGLLIGYSKTEVAEIGRKFRKVYDAVCYTTKMQELPFKDVYGAVAIAYKLMMDKEDDVASITGITSNPNANLQINK